MRWSSRAALALSALAAGCGLFGEEKDDAARRLPRFRDIYPYGTFVLAKEGVSLDDLESRLRSAGSAVSDGFSVVRVARYDRLPWLYVAWTEAGGPYPSLYEKLDRLPGVARSEPNPYFREAGAPKAEKEKPEAALRPDPDLKKQWNLQRPEEGGVGAVDAWEVLGERPANQVVAVLDAGFDLEHPDLRPALYADCESGKTGGFDAVDGDADASETLREHGTAVAGLVAAARGNGIGIAGVAGGYARILPVRVASYPKRQIESLATLDAILAGLEYVLDAKRRCEGANGAQFRIAHLGLTREGGGTPAPLGETIDVLREDGMLLVAPAGNHANDVDSAAEWPAAYESENLLVVTGVRRKGFLEKYVNRGRVGVDVAAPGGGLTSLAAGGGTFGGFEGSSFASAQAAGAAALVLACFDGFDPASIKTALEKTVAPKPNLPVRWAGTLDAGEAVTELARAGWCGPAKVPPKVEGLPGRKDLSRR